MNPRVAPAFAACAILVVFGAVLGAILGNPLPARAGVEEFSTFGVEEQ